MTHQTIIDEKRRKARLLFETNANAGAATLYRQILDALPDDVEALLYLGQVEAANGRVPEALNLLGTAFSVAPGSSEARLKFGILLLMVGDLARAEDVLSGVTADQTHFGLARLYLGLVQQQLGRRFDARISYFTAIHQAQKQGAWTSEETTPMAVRGLVLDAMKFLRTLPDIVFEELVGPLRHQYGASELARVEYAFNSYLGRVSAKPTDARQNPRYFFFPGLPASPYIGRRNLEWLDQLEDCTEMMRAEVLSMIANGETFEPFLKLSSASNQDEYVGGYEGHKGAWNAFFFYRHGARYDENCARCTGTAQALGELPLVTIERHAPEVLFSILEPKSYIAPHHGSTNTRITVHLPLEVPTRAAPEDCSLVVGGVEHPWERGRAVAFDDTFEHSARNLADQRRLVLIMDAWNPALTIPEREAIASLIPVLGSIWG